MRAIGLAIELGHKAGLDKGRGAVTKEDLCKVQVGGAAQVWDSSGWCDVRKCKLSLRTQDSDLAFKVFLKQKRWLQDLGFNIYQADVRKAGAQCTLDLVGDLSEAAASRLGLTGKVWVELVCFKEENYWSSVGKEVERLEELLPKVRRSDPNIQAVMLLSCKVERIGNQRLGNPRLEAKIWTGDGEWQHVAARLARADRGFAPSPKLDLVAVFSQLTWHNPRNSRGKIVKGAKVALLNHFLKNLKLSKGNVGKTTLSFNKKLAKSGFSGRLKRMQLTRQGSRPYVATKRVLRKVYEML